MQGFVKTYEVDIDPAFSSQGTAGHAASFEALHPCCVKAFIELGHLQQAV